MTTGNPNRGGAPVGHIADLDAVSAGAVLYLRAWCDGPDAQARICSDFATALGPEAGARAFQSFEEVCALCVRHGRRPLMRHHLTCQCLGADEACFANFIATASEGCREDALMIASVLVRADMAFCLIDHAQAFGLAIKRMALRAMPPAPMMHSGTLH